jgi:hypothetical protein
MLNDVWRIISDELWRTKDEGRGPYDAGRNDCGTLKNSDRNCDTKDNNIFIQKL